MVFALAACKDDGLFDDYQDSQTRSALSGQMGQEQRLGYGYNAAYTITDNAAFSTKPILNYSKLVELEQSYGQLFSEEPRNITTTDVLTGNTLQELCYSETQSETKFRGFAGCGKTYSKETTVISQRTQADDVAKIKIKTVVSSRTVDVGMLKSLNMSFDPNDNNSILAPEYRTAVNELVKKYGSNINGITLSDAAVTNFCETYGTHLVASADLGGVVELQMTIDRNSCIETTHAIEEEQVKIFGIPAGSSKPQRWTSVDSLKNLKYNAQLFVYGGSEATKKIMHDKVSQKVQGTIATSEYRQWASSIVCKPGTSENNATFVRGRYVPLYELLPESQDAARQVLTRIFELYLKESAPTGDNYEPPYGYFNVRQTLAYNPYVLSNSNVQIVNYGGNYAAVLCMEYVPSIRGDKPCVVAYPLIRSNDGKSYRPYLYSGYFVGDDSHRPGVVKWQGSASFYVPSDSIYYGKDAQTNALFDPVSKSLKKLYVYWNNVRPLPCPTKDGELMNLYSLNVYSSQGTAQNATTFAKVGDTFWSVKPMRAVDNGKVMEQYKNYSWYTKFQDKRKIGIAYSESGGYDFMLGEGGDMPLTISNNDAPQFNQKVRKALAKTIYAYNGIINQMPTREQAQNLGKVLGGRTYILFDQSFPSKRNILGLDWPSGYRAIAGASIEYPNTMQTLDDKAKVILSREWAQWSLGSYDIVPVRIGASGGTTAFDHFEYISAFNFSSSEFFRYYPIYIVKTEFTF